MKTTTTQVQDLSDLLRNSKATDSFKDGIRELEAGEPQSLIACNGGCPPIKVLRFTLKLLETLPDVPLESVTIKASSGCSNFTGSAVAQPGNIQIEFNWDCAWRARELGWTDHYGDPDQIRAARNFGYQCFERFIVK